MESRIALGLAKKLENDFWCNTFLGDGKTPSPFKSKKDHLRSKVEESGVVILSASEFCEIEVCAGEYAIELGKPLVLMALFHGQLKKKEYAPFRQHISRVFVLDEDEAKTAQKLYPSAKVVVTGNPEWETFSFPIHTRDEVRNILKIASQEKFILVSGEKELMVNVPLAVNMIEAVANLPYPEQFKIIFTIHPGHMPLPGGADLLRFYKELEEYHPKVSIRFSCKGDPFGIGTSDMVPGADLVIGTNSTVQIQAGYLRIPAIAILLRRAFRGIELPREHKEWWVPCDRGAIAPVYGLSSNKTTELITTLLSAETAEGFVPMLEAQKRLFPTFTKVGQAYEAMAKAIEKL